MREINVRNEEAGQVTRIRFGHLADAEDEFTTYLSRTMGNDLCISNGTDYVFIHKSDVEYLIKALKAAEDMGWIE